MPAGRMTVAGEDVLAGDPAIDGVRELLYPDPLLFSRDAGYDSVKSSIYLLQGFRELLDPDPVLFSGDAGDDSVKREANRAAGWLARRDNQSIFFGLRASQCHWRWNWKRLYKKILKSDRKERIYPSLPSEGNSLCEHTECYDTWLVAGRIEHITILRFCYAGTVYIYHGRTTGSYHKFLENTTQPKAMETAKSEFDNFLQKTSRPWQMVVEDLLETVDMDPFICARRGDIDYFRNVAPEILLRAREQGKPKEDNTVLDVAAICGQLECCKVIVERCTGLLYYQSLSTDYSVLHNVALSKNLEMIKFLITADSKPDLEGKIPPNKRLLLMKTRYGSTALHLAVANRNLEVTKLLIEADHDRELLRMVDDDGCTCLHIAAFKSDPVAAELIIKACPDNDYLKMQTRWKQTALHAAAEKRCLAVVKLLIEADHGKDLLGVVDSKQQTALHYAVQQKNLDMVKLLIEADHGKDFLGVVDSKQQTALHYAVQQGNLDMVKLLIEADHGKDLLGVVDSKQQTALHYAVQQGNLDMVKLISEGVGLDQQLLSMPDFKKNTPLHLAVRNRNVEIVKLLTQGSVAIDYCANNSNHTPLLMAINEAIYSSDSQVIWKLLLEKDPGQCRKQTGDMGWTPLHYATSYGLDTVVKDIIQLCPDCTKIVDVNGRTFLHIAVNLGRQDVVKHFLEMKNTDVVTLLYTQDKDGNTPLQWAMGKVLSNEYSKTEKTPELEIIHMLLEKTPEQCKRRTGEMKWTYLHHAASKGHISLIKEMVELCPDCAKELDEHKQTFIHIAVNNGLVEVVKSIMGLKEIDPAVLDTEDEDGNTALHIAALNKNQEMTLCLLYDDRVSKEIENNKKDRAVDLIHFPYDEGKAKVYSIGHQRDLKDQSSFDLLVAALIATVSFTAGFTVPGGYISDGTNKGSAVLLKATAFKVFVVSNNFALLFSLYTVFLNFSTRRILKEEDIYYESSSATFRTRLLHSKKDLIYQFNMATLCILSAVYAMVVAFITGSYAVLANSDGLSLTVCVSSCCFLILATYATWTMAMEYWHSKPVTGVSSQASPGIRSVQPGLRSLTFKT